MKKIILTLLSIALIFSQLMADEVQLSKSEEMDILKEEVEETNIGLPIEVEPGVTIEKVLLEDKTIVYKVLMGKKTVGIDSSFLKNEEKMKFLSKRMKHRLKRKLKKTLCRNEYTQNFLKEDISFKYDYYFKGNIPLTSIFIDKNDCQ